MFPNLLHIYSQCLLVAAVMLPLVSGQNNGGGGGGQGGGEECGVECLREVIPGEPKQDYPIYGQSFLCKLNPKNPGCPGWGK